jgi:hypothetical protein
MGGRRPTPLSRPSAAELYHTTVTAASSCGSGSLMLCLSQITLQLNWWLFLSNYAVFSAKTRRKAGDEEP